MADTPTLMFTAVYDKVQDALADLDAVGHLPEQGIVGSYDAAVIDKEDGEPHIVKRIDQPSYRLIPELVGRGTLPRKELKQAAQELMEDEAGLVVVGESTLDDYFERRSRARRRPPSTRSTRRQTSSRTSSSARSRAEHPRTRRARSAGAALRTWPPRSSCAVPGGAPVAVDVDVDEGLVGP